MRSLAFVLLLVAVVFAADPFCAGPAPFGCVASEAVFTNPESNRLNLVCYNGIPCDTPDLNNPPTECPCSDINGEPSAHTDPAVGFPVQIRWGTPVGSNQKSGFGYRGTTGVPVGQPGELFYLGVAAHLNYVIARNTAVNKWDTTLSIGIKLPDNTVQETTFVMNLELEETSNVNMDICPQGSDCFGTAYWGAHQEDTLAGWVRPNCVRCGTTSDYGLNGDCSGNHPCCPFRTNSLTCADRVQTLSQFDVESPWFTINNFEYQIVVSGFTVPGSQGTTAKQYFISQETEATQAEIWGTLVQRCPVAGERECNGYYHLNSDGTKCICECDTARVTCLPPRVYAQSQDQTDCECQCPAEACSYPQIVGDPADPNCECVCPETYCTPPKSYLNPYTCQCECPTHETPGFAGKGKK